MTQSSTVVQNPIQPSIDLRDMLRQYLVSRSLECMAASAHRRQKSLETGDVASYRQAVRAAVRGFYGDLPVGPSSAPVHATQVSTFDKGGYRLENVLFDSFLGWQVNATVYVPLDFRPPFPAVVVPVGHSGKQFENYQLPAQFFARCGYLAVLFDPPGQASEKQEGNDHFVDGVRCYLVGETSSQYFIADAIRCIDYLETRNDVDMNRGVAMTGVSGGGTTTTFAALLDDRTSVAGPSCCVSPLADLDITQCYAGCPETHMWRRYAEGIDEVDLLCAAFPTPLLLMAGELDEVFHIEDTRRLAAQVEAFYTEAGAAEQFQFFVDHAGHCYSLTQARQFVGFMNRWLLSEPDRTLPDLDSGDFSLDPYEQLQCSPRLDVNMRSLTLDRATELEKNRSKDADRICAAATAVSGVTRYPSVPQAIEGKPFQIWTHNWQQVLLRAEEGIELPTTFVCSRNHPTPALLHLDDQHRNRLLYRNDLLARAIHFLNIEDPGLAVLSVDLRGWGDTKPAMYPYEMAGWGSIDRYLAYTSAALGDAVLSMRVRDALAALAYLRSQPEVISDHIVLSGCGLGGIVALHVAAIDKRIQKTVIWDTLISFRALLAEKAYTWPADAFVPRVLLHYDLPDLVRALSCPVTILGPLDGQGQPLPDLSIQALNDSLAQQVYRPCAAPDDIIRAIQDN